MASASQEPTPEVSHLELILRGDGVLPRESTKTLIQKKQKRAQKALNLSDSFGGGDATATISTPPQVVHVASESEEHSKEEVDLSDSMASSVAPPATTAAAAASAASAPASATEQNPTKGRKRMSPTSESKTETVTTPKKKKARTTAEPVAIGNVLGKKGAVRGKNPAAIPPSSTESQRNTPKKLSSAAAAAAAAATAAFDAEEKAKPKAQPKARASPKAKAKPRAKAKAKARASPKPKAKAKAKAATKKTPVNRPTVPSIDGSRVHPQSVEDFKTTSGYTSMLSWTGFSFAEKRAGPSTSHVPTAARASQLEASGREKEGQQLLRIVLPGVITVGMACMFADHPLDNGPGSVADTDEGATVVV